MRASKKASGNPGAGAAAFFAEVLAKKYAIYQLVRRELAERYSGTYLGLFWAFAQHAVMLLVMAFVLQVGFKVKPSGDIPFIAWIVPALTLWVFFHEALQSASGALVSYAYIVKKIQFKVSILPLVKVLSAFCIHGIFLLIAVGVLLLSGIAPKLAWLQFAYYSLACAVLVLGLGWLFSAVMVFFRDLSSVLTISLNIGMWLTPIYWNPEILPERYRLIAYLNPVCYLTEGYRRSFLYGTPLWCEPLWSLYFWTVTLAILLTGVFVFRKLKPHFADVL